MVGLHEDSNAFMYLSELKEHPLFKGKGGLAEKVQDMLVNYTVDHFSGISGVFLSSFKFSFKIF